MMWQTDQNRFIQTETQIKKLFHQSTLVNKTKKMTNFFPPMCCCANQLSIKAIIQHVCLNKTWMVHYNLQ